MSAAAKIFSKIRRVDAFIGAQRSLARFIFLFPNGDADLNALDLPGERRERLRFLLIGTGLGVHLLCNGNHGNSILTEKLKSV